MGLIKLFTSFSGRIGRTGFWGGLIVLFLLGGAATYEVLMLLTSGDPSGAFKTLAGELTTAQQLTYMALLWPLMALIIKRLHDRNKSGFWAALIWVPALIKLGHPWLVEYLGDGWMVKMGVSFASKVLTAEMAAVGFWFLFELGLLGSKNHDNRFGGDLSA